VTTAVVVPAAGRGERLGAGVPKALVPVRGVPLLVHAVLGLAAAPSVASVVVAAPPDGVEPVRRALADALPDRPELVTVVAGGSTRADSVALGLAAVGPDVDVVLVHDAARAFAPPALVETVVAAVRRGAPAVVPGLPVPDTVRKVAEDGTAHETPDRASLRAVQTPQGFRRAVLDEAYARRSPSQPPTDDAALVEQLGVAVHVVAGSDEAFKVTRPVDLLLAEALLAAREAREAGGVQA
jgi:2-C-methyl-D-erythritol 4-phosphate cytidylyltransferase